jgi:hypothetical protein
MCVSQAAPLLALIAAARGAIRSPVTPGRTVIPESAVARGNAASRSHDAAFVNNPPDHPDTEWRSYIDDEDDGDEYLAPDPFAVPQMPASEQEPK